MTEWKIDRDLLSLAESGRDLLGPDFFNARDVAESAFTNGEPMPQAVARGSGTEIQLVRAAVTELRDLLCTQNSRYKEVRAKGNSFAKMAVPAMAGYVAASLGISVALATAGVAFVALTVLKLGAGIFCRVTAPH